MNGGPPPLVSPTEAGLLYPYSEYPYGLSPTTLFEYPTGLEQTAAGTFQVRWTKSYLRACFAFQKTNIKNTPFATMVRIVNL